MAKVQVSAENYQKQQVITNEIVSRVVTITPNVPQLCPVGQLKE
jgi:hypothetical protein